MRERVRRQHGAIPALVAASPLLALCWTGCAPRAPIEPAEDSVNESAIVSCRSILESSETSAVREALEGARNECVFGAHQPDRE